VLGSWPSAKLIGAAPPATVAFPLAVEDHLRKLTMYNLKC
jgi:hypothetical protein